MTQSLLSLFHDLPIGLGTWHMGESPAAAQAEAGNIDILSLYQRGCQDAVQTAGQ